MTTMREKLIKIGAKGVRLRRHRFAGAPQKQKIFS